MQVEIAFANEISQVIYTIEIKAHCTVKEAIVQSGLLEKYPSMQLQKHAVGIFGKTVTYDTVLKANDRVEIYSALLLDPMTQRRLRAKEKY